MKASRVIALILGVLVVIGGIYCLMTPGLTYLSLAWLLGLIMVVDGIANIVTWFELRKEGASNGWALAAAIVSVVLGVIVLGSYAAQLAVDLFIAYMLAAWLIVSGIARILFGWRMRKLHKTFDTLVIGKNWWAAFILGILLVVVGVLSLFNPTALMLATGMMIGLAIIISGVSVIALAL